MNRIFLGGTCAGTNWRDRLIDILDNHYECEYFNPVVEDWTPECQQIEEDEKNNKCNVHLYVLTPQMKGVYSIAEIINSCWQAQVYGTTVDYVALYILGEWDKDMRKSLEATIRLCSYITPNFTGHFCDNESFMVNDLAENKIISLK